MLELQNWSGVLDGMSFWGWVVQILRAIMMLGAGVGLFILWKTRHDPDLPKEFHKARKWVAGSYVVILLGNGLAFTMFPHLNLQLIAILIGGVAPLVLLTPWFYWHFSQASERKTREGVKHGTHQG